MVQFFSRSFSYEYVSYILYLIDFVAHQVGVGAVQASVVACQLGHLEKIPKPAVCTRSLSRVRLLSSYLTPSPPFATPVVGSGGALLSPLLFLLVRRSLG